MVDGTESSVEETKQNVEYCLQGIIYITPHQWSVWINNKLYRYPHKEISRLVRIDYVTGDHVILLNGTEKIILYVE